MEKPSRLTTVVIAVLTGLSLVCGVGCYGSFPLVRAVHRVNDTPGNDLVDSFIFWLFMILPVYEIAFIGDVFVLNLMEFWTRGDVGLTQRPSADTGRYTLRSAGKNRARLTKSEGGRTVAIFRRLSDKVCQVRGPGGRLFGRMVRDKRGHVRLENADGKTIRKIHVDRIRQRLRAAK